MNQLYLIFKREWISYFNTPIGYIVICSHVFLSNYCTFEVSKILESQHSSLVAFFEWQPWIFLVLVPALTMRMWSEERKTGTLELLLSAPISTKHAILGKFLAAWMLFTLSLSLTFSIPITIIILGTPDIGPIFTGYIGCILLSGAYIAVGSWASTASNNQVASYIFSVLILTFAIYIGSMETTTSMIASLPYWATEVISGFGVLSHFNRMITGIIDLRDFLYFASIMIYMLLATQVTLENRFSK